MENASNYEIIVRNKKGVTLLNQSFDGKCAIGVIRKSWPLELNGWAKAEIVYSNQEANGKVELNIEINGIGEVTEKVTRLLEILKEAESLANDLASMDLRINFCE